MQTKITLALSPAELQHIEVALRIELERYDEDLSNYAVKDKVGRKRAAKLHAVFAAARAKAGC